MNGALDFFISNRQMRLQAYIIAQFAIAGHLAATLLARPLLGGCNKSASEGLQTQVGIDIPAFDVTDVARVTAFGVVAYARLKKTAENSVLPIDNENRSFPIILMKIVVDLKLVIVFTIRPQGAAHA